MGGRWGRNDSASTGSFEIGHVDRNRYQVRLRRSWQDIRKTIFLRQNVANAILRKLIEMVKKQAAEADSKITGDVKIDFTSDELSDAIKSDLTLSVEVKKVHTKSYYDRANSVEIKKVHTASDYDRTDSVKVQKRTSI